VRSVARDGQTWRLGTSADVAWIDNGTSIGKTISAAVPVVFQAYATVVHPEYDEDAQERHDQALVSLLRQHSAGQPWWLGYLDTGVGELPFPNAPMVTLYVGWRYLLVEAGPEQATTWRQPNEIRFRMSVLPDLMFPADRSWLLSTMWDDDWSCVGGPAELVADLLRHPDLEARRVRPGEDATPSGHTAL
jgi:hypothetical protein